MATRYTLQVVQVAEIQVPTLELYHMDVTGQWEPLVFYIGVLRGTDGKTYLINSGLPSDTGVGKGYLNDFWASWHPNAAIRQHLSTTDALAQVGLRPEDVDAILFTPLTCYTTGGMHRFPRADFYFGRRGWIDFWAPEPFWPRLPQNIYFPPDVLQYIASMDLRRIKLLDDEAGEFLPGIRAWFAGGHHRSSMAYLIETEKGVVAWCDGVFKYPNIEQDRPLGISESLHETLATYARLKREAQIIIPPYDPEVLVRYPGGKIA